MGSQARGGSLTVQRPTSRVAPGASGVLGRVPLGTLEGGHVGLYFTTDPLHPGRWHRDAGGMLHGQHHGSGEAGISMAATGKGAMVVIVRMTALRGGFVRTMTITIIVVPQVAVMLQHMGQHLGHAHPLMHLQRAPGEEREGEEEEDATHGGRKIEARGVDDRQVRNARSIPTWTFLGRAAAAMTAPESQKRPSGPQTAPGRSQILTTSTWPPTHAGTPFVPDPSKIRNDQYSTPPVPAADACPGVVATL